jgi:acyl carrier protein phosphodiesterase
MNYLGHAYLSFGDKDTLTGNMIGDHVKGKAALDDYPPGIRKGIELHRHIDARTDIHPATLRGKLLFREDYGLYAGAIMDTLYDHFLANDPHCFASEQTLYDFSQATYRQLEENLQFLPATFLKYFESMKEHNWLYNYRHMKGIERSLSGLVRRAQYMPPPEKAYQIFVSHYYVLNQCYFEAFDDINRFVKNGG